MNHDHLLLPAFQSFVGLVGRATNPLDGDGFPSASGDWYVRHVVFNGDGSGGLPNFSARVRIGEVERDVEAWPDGVAIARTDDRPLLILTLADVSRSKEDDELLDALVQRIRLHLFDNLRQGSQGAQG